MGLNVRAGGLTSGEGPRRPAPVVDRLRASAFFLIGAAGTTCLRLMSRHSSLFIVAARVSCGRFSVS